MLLAGDEAANARDGDGNSPLHHAAWNSQLSAMQLLLDHDADINLQSDQLWTPLHWATRNGRAQSVGWLLDHGAKVDVPAHLGHTALHLAAKYNYRVTLALLLAAPARLPRHLRRRHATHARRALLRVGAAQLDELLQQARRGGRRGAPD